MVDPRLTDKDETVRLAALGELFSSREADPDRLEDAAAFLGENGQNVRRLAVEVLVMFGSDGAPYLASALDRSQPLEIRTAAAVGLGRLGHDGVFGVPALARCLESEDEQLREKASWALSRIGADALPLLRSVLRSSNPHAVLGALDALERMGEEAREGSEDVQALASSTNSTAIRIACLSAVARISATPDHVVSEILSTAQDANEAIRKMCVERVTGLGGLGKDFGEEIARFARDDSATVRSVAAMGLAKVQANPGESVPVLITLLDDPDEEVREQAVVALACIGPAATDAVPALVGIMREGQGRLAGMAGAALDQINPSDRAKT